MDEGDAAMEAEQVALNTVANLSDLTCQQTAPRLPIVMSEHIRVVDLGNGVHDFMSPSSPAFVEGRAYILINVDYLIRSLNAIATAQSTAEEVCEVWNYHISNIVGWPRILHWMYSIRGTSLLLGSLGRHLLSRILRQRLCWKKVPIHTI